MPPFEDKVFSSICHGIGHLYTDGWLCDLAVEVGKSTFSCHGVLLAAVSEYFQDLLCEGNLKGMVNIESEHVSPDIFATILNILYKGKDELKDTDTAVNILNAAIFLKIQFLKEHCEEFLSSRFDELVVTDLFLVVPRQSLYAILSSKNLQASSEDNVCKALLKWVEHDVDQRACHLPEFLPFLRFCNMSEAYLWELYNQSLNYNAALFDYIKEALMVQREESEKINSLKRTEILFRQEKITSFKNMQRIPVFLGIVSETENCTFGVYPIQNEDSFEINGQVHPKPDTDIRETDALVPQPEDCGADFASCVWRNELYISGGSKNPQYFAVYNTGRRDWRTLPDIPRGKEKHAMAAVNWNIYILGGLDTGAYGQKIPTDLVLSYNVKTNSWNTVTSLLKCLEGVAAVVLGHRIYMFGGRDAEGNSTNLVQCLDTNTGCVYQAGCMPSPSFGACALGRAGSVFVILPEGHILHMQEKMAITDEREKMLTVQNTKLQMAEGEDKTVYCSSVQEQTVATVPESDIKLESDEFPEEETAKISVHAMDDKTHDAPGLSTVYFKHLADISRRQNFGAYIDEREIVILGGQTIDGAFLENEEIVHLETKEVKERPSELVKPISHCKLHFLNSPKWIDTVDLRFKFLPNSLPDDAKEIRSHDFRLGNFTCCLGVCKIKSRPTDEFTINVLPKDQRGSYCKPDGRFPQLGVYLWKHKTNHCRYAYGTRDWGELRNSQWNEAFAYDSGCHLQYTAVNWNVKLKIIFWIPPTLPGCKEQYKEGIVECADSKPFRHGIWDYIYINELMDPQKGYVRNGEVTLEAKISIVELPTIENEDDSY